MTIASVRSSWMPFAADASAVLAVVQIGRQPAVTYVLMPAYWGDPDHRRTRGFFRWRGEFQPSITRAAPG